MVPYQNDQYLLVGNFSSVNNVPLNQLARINADGSIDTSFAPRLSSSFPNNLSVWVQADGKILTYSRGLSRLLPDGSIDSGFVFDRDGVSGGINRAAAEDSKGRILWGGGSLQIRCGWK